MSAVGALEVKKRIIGQIHLLHEIPGYSAYEIAVRHGYKGTEAEWLASINGKDGEKGEPGTLQSHTEVDAQGHRVINVAEPVSNTDAVSKGYADGKFLILDDIKDVSADFAGVVSGATLSSKKVYKYGKLINGIITLTNITSEAVMVSFDMAVRPKAGVVVNAAAFNSSGTPIEGAYAFSWQESDIVNYFTCKKVSSGAAKLVFAFTYICS